MTVARNPIRNIQRPAPLGPIEPKQSLLLRFDALHPEIRFAQRVDTILIIAERIIFDHELVLIEQGELEFISPEGAIVVSAGDLIFIPPFVPHTFHSTASSVHLAVHFDFAPGIPRWPAEDDSLKPYEVCWPAGITIPRRTMLAPGHKISHMLRGIIERASEAAADPLAEIDSSAVLTTVLVDLLRRGRSASNDSGTDAVHQINRLRMAAVLDHIQRNLSEPLSLEQLAEVASLSRSRFVTIFKRFTGSSPLHYVLEARVAKARRLLADPALSIKQVAAMVGFEDSLYFSKVFRRVDGLTPSQFRAAALGGACEILPDEP